MPPSRPQHRPQNSITASLASAASTASTAIAAEFADITAATSPPPVTSPTPEDIQHHVDISAAEDEFHALERNLTRISIAAAQSRRSSLISHQTATTPAAPPPDVEKAEQEAIEEEAERFNLEQTLRGDETAERTAGIKPKRIGVLFDDLSVSGLGGGKKSYIPTFPDAVIGFFNVFALVKGLVPGLSNVSGKEFNILQGFKGVVKPGEMCLVLGRPGSGCTTFLRLMANQRVGYTNVGGEVSFGRIGSKEFGKRFRGEALYNYEVSNSGGGGCGTEWKLTREQDDTHHLPTLTVEQTLGFALDVKTPGKLPEGVTRKQFKKSVIDTMLKMFNIVHTRNTVVGNQFIRGVSGGERKRVSIAEMMLTKCSISCWDQVKTHFSSSLYLSASMLIDNFSLFVASTLPLHWITQNPCV